MVSTVPGTPGPLGIRVCTSMTFAIGLASSVSPGWAARFPSPHPAGLPSIRTRIRRLVQRLFDVRPNVPRGSDIFGAPRPRLGTSEPAVAPQSSHRPRGSTAAPWPLGHHALTPHTHLRPHHPEPHRPPGLFTRYRARLTPGPPRAGRRATRRTTAGPPAPPARPAGRCAVPAT